MKIPNKIKEEHSKCISCGMPIHIDELGMITKEGLCHNNAVCLAGYFRRSEKTQSTEDKK